MRVYIEVRGIGPASKPVLRSLWKTVSSDLCDDPMSREDKDIHKVMSGLFSIVDGLGGIRDKASSAHGRGLTVYKVERRHARLAVFAATTFCNYIVDTWESRRLPSPPVSVSRPGIGSRSGGVAGRKVVVTDPF